MPGAGDKMIGTKVDIVLKSEGLFSELRCRVVSHSWPGGGGMVKRGSRGVAC